MIMLLPRKTFRRTYDVINSIPGMHTYRILRTLAGFFEPPGKQFFLPMFLFERVRALASFMRQRFNAIIVAIACALPSRVNQNPLT